MATGSQEHNMLKVMEQHLEKIVKETITENLVKEATAEFQKRFRENLKPLVDNITMGKIEHMKDVMRMREEIHVYVHHKDEK